MESVWVYLAIGAGAGLLICCLAYYYCVDHRHEEALETSVPRTSVELTSSRLAGLAPTKEISPHVKEKKTAMEHSGNALAATTEHAQIADALKPAMRASEEYFNAQMEADAARCDVLTKEQREARRRLQMTAIFKGFDLSETGEITLEGFRCIGAALNWGQWSDQQNQDLHNSMDLNQDGVVRIDEWLEFYDPVITIISDAAFEDGLCEFEDAVHSCCQKQGIYLPPRFAHDDDYVYNTGSFFEADPVGAKLSQRWSTQAGHSELKSVRKSTEPSGDSDTSRVIFYKDNIDSQDPDFDRTDGDMI